MKNFPESSLTLVFRPDSEVRQEGWRSDILEAYVDQNRAGYIIMSYIAQEDFDQIYTNHPYGPTIAWLAKSGHWFDFEEPQEVILDKIRKRYLPLNTPDNKILILMEKKFRKQLSEFKNFHVNKPLVDFSRVYQDTDDREKVFPCRGKENMWHAREESVDYRGIGLADILYWEMARILASQNLKFYASGLQSPEAVGFWKKFSAKVENAIEYETVEESTKTRVVLNGKKLGPMIFPNWVSSIRYIVIPGINGNQEPDWDTVDTNITIQRRF